MELSLTLIDERMKPAQYGLKVEREEFDRVRLTNLTGSASVVAATLRGIADELAPTGLVR